MIVLAGIASGTVQLNVAGLGAAEMVKNLSKHFSAQFLPVPGHATLKLCLTLLRPAKRTA